MFFKLIKKDLSKQKSMNLILFLFVILTSMLIAGSCSVMFSAGTALDSYMEKAKTKDYYSFLMKDAEQDKRLERWVKNCSEVKEYEIYNGININVDQVKISSVSKFEMSGMLMILPENHKTSTVLDSETEEEFNLKPGEIAVPLKVCNDYDVKVGDKMTFTMEGHKFTYTISHLVQDALCGPSIMGASRYIVTQDDFNKIYNITPELKKIEQFSAKAATSVRALNREYSKQDYSSFVAFDVGTVKMAYFLDLMVVLFLVIVSIFLLLLAFLILRFTIVFTLQEDFSQIGIMKAIGMKHRSIKKLYLAKYAFLSILGGLIGFILSIPLANGLLKSVSRTMIINISVTSTIMSVLGVAVEVLIILGFCSLCTRRIRKFSVIDAIRNGKSGVSYGRKRRFALHRRKHLPVTLFLSANDLTSGFRRFVVLCIAFIAATILVILPANLATTFKSDYIYGIFGMEGYDFYMETDQLDKYQTGGTYEEVKKDLKVVEDKAREHGLDIKLRVRNDYSARVYTNDANDCMNIRILKEYDHTLKNSDMTEGKAPEEENEMAISTRISDYYNVKVGDSINCVVGKDKKQYLVSGVYQTVNNMGNAARYSNKLNPSFKDATFILVYGDLKKGVDVEQSIQKLKKLFPQYKFKSKQEDMESQTGGILGQIDMIKIIIIAFVMAINFLITILTTKMLLSKEVSGVAILKSMGFTNRSIRHWQVGRILMLLIISIAAGIALFGPLGSLMYQAVFSMFGVRNIEIHYSYFEQFLILPAIMLLVTGLATWISSRAVKNIKVWEINQAE